MLLILLNKLKMVSLESHHLYYDILISNGDKISDRDYCYSPSKDLDHNLGRNKVFLKVRNFERVICILKYLGNLLLVYGSERYSFQKPQFYNLHNILVEIRYSFIYQDMNSILYDRHMEVHIHLIQVLLMVNMLQYHCLFIK